MTPRGRDKRDGERGQILVMMVISLLAICALVAVAADTGFFFDYRRRMQSGADSAAMAGAEQLLTDLMSDANVQSVGLKAAESNGFKNMVDDAQVTINHPPLSGFYANRADKNNFVEAVITQPRPTVFMGILGFQSATVSARAVAGIKDSETCVLQLNPTAPLGLNLNGGATVNARCRIVVNSNDSDALDEGGNACMTATSIDVTGSTGGNNNCYTPAPKTGVPREPDPFAGLAAPTFSPTCDANHTNWHQNSGTWPLQPGAYCGGITIGSAAQVTFEPGVYILYGGGFKVTGGTLSGTGVTFYNTGTATGATKYDTISISGGASGALKAPTSGPMATILFFQDRTLTSTLTSSQLKAKNSVGGSPSLTLEGTLYFPSTPLSFEGGSSPTGAAHYTILIADTFVFTGSSAFNNDFTNLPDGSPLKAVALAE